jgi:hypothetical protein
VRPEPWPTPRPARRSALSSTRPSAPTEARPARRGRRGRCSSARPVAVRPSRPARRRGLRRQMPADRCLRPPPPLQVRSCRCWRNETVVVIACAIRSCHGQTRSVTPAACPTRCRDFAGNNTKDIPKSAYWRTFVCASRLAGSRTIRDFKVFPRDIE